MQAKIDEFCSLSFDEVDPAEQMGLTFRMLVGLKSLAETLSFWDGDQKREEEAFRLLGLEEEDMHTIGRMIRRAMKLIDSNRYRDAYDRLRGARPWFQAADGQALEAQRTQLRAAASGRKVTKAERKAKALEQADEDVSGGEWTQVPAKKASERLRALAARR